MGWMVVGMGRFTGLETKTAEGAERAEDLEISGFPVQRPEIQRPNPCSR